MLLGEQVILEELCLQEFLKDMRGAPGLTELGRSLYLRGTQYMNSLIAVWNTAEEE